MISIFRRDVDENCSILDYYAASSDNSLTFRDNLKHQESLILYPWRWDR